MKNSIKKSCDTFEKLLEKANFKPGMLFFLPCNKYFWKLAKDESVAFSLEPEEDNHIQPEDFKPSIMNYDLVSPYVRVPSHAPILFIGFLEVDASIKIKSSIGSNGEKTDFYIINKQNYKEFYDPKCKWNKNKNYKNLVDNLVKNNFKYKILEFLFDNQILWWSHLQLNNGINGLKETFITELS